MTRSFASIIILSLTCSIFALACGQDEGTQPTGDAIQVVADAGPLPADGATAQDDAAKPTPDGAAPPQDTVKKPDTALPPDMKLPPDAAPCNTALQGSYTCNYSGGLVAFDKKQTGTIQGNVDMGGAFAGQIKHSYNSSLKKTYSATGSITGGKFTGSGKGSLYPNPKSVVAWKVSFAF